MQKPSTQVQEKGSQKGQKIPTYFFNIKKIFNVLVSTNSLVPKHIFEYFNRLQSKAGNHR